MKRVSCQVLTYILRMNQGIAQFHIFDDMTFLCYYHIHVPDIYQHAGMQFQMFVLCWLDIHPVLAFHSQGTVGVVDLSADLLLHHYPVVDIDLGLKLDTAS